jgi:hypothetical protein
MFLNHKIAKKGIIPAKIQMLPKPIKHCLAL